MVKHRGARARIRKSRSKDKVPRSIRGKRRAEMLAKAAKETMNFRQQGLRMRSRNLY